MKIAFDVDDTLILPAIATGFGIDTPNYEIVELYRWFQRQGHYMIIWSGSGIDYAKRWAERLGLHADEFPIKAIREDLDIAFDDSASANLGKVTVIVKRSNNSISREEWNKTKCEPEAEKGGDA